MTCARCGIPMHADDAAIAVGQNLLCETCSEFACPQCGSTVDCNCDEYPEDCAK